MLARLLAGLAIWTLLAACCFALSDSVAPVSQSVSTPVAPLPPYMPAAKRPIRPESPVDLQMRALEHHARVNMILYTGRFGGSAWAANSRRLDAIALTVKAGR